jgi:hypothetical protein
LQKRDKTRQRRQWGTYSFGYTFDGAVQNPALPPVHHEQYEYEHTMTKLGAVLGDDDQSRRVVPAPAGSSYHITFGFVTIDGVTYWAKADAEQIMSFDLRDDRVALFVECPPMPAAARTKNTSWLHRHHHHLTDVRGRLGVVVCFPYDEFFHSSKTEVRIHMHIMKATLSTGSSSVFLLERCCVIGNKTRH